MSQLLIFLALFVFGFVFSATLPSESENITKRERFLLAVMRVHSKGCMGRSNSLNEKRHGICLPKNDCIKNGGKYLGPCALLGACCEMTKTCSGSTSGKVSYFESPTTTTAGRVNKICSLEIIKLPGVCQMRLDFEVFNLKAPTTKETLPYHSKPSYECIDQYLSIDSETLPSIRIPRFCGDNSGHHVYIPVLSTTRQVTLSVITETPYISSGSWRIKITQLECNITQHGIDIAAPASSLTSLQNPLSHHAEQVDFPPLAPPGCLQFYPEPSGVFESFNFRDLHYIGNLHYAICFHRGADDCGIRFITTPENFQFDQCNTNFPSVSDYLLIKEGDNGTRIITSEFTDYWCNPNSGTITSYAPGPFEVIFRTDNYTVIPPRYSDKGFRINYQVLKNCADYLYSSYF